MLHWIALAGGAIFAGGMIRLEVVKTDGVFPIIFSFFFYGTLFNIVAGFLLVDYLGETPPIEFYSNGNVLNCFVIILFHSYRNCYSLGTTN